MTRRSMPRNIRKVDDETEADIQKAIEGERGSREGNTMVFTGSLSSKNMTDLQDLASALHLSMDGTESDLLERIKAHLEAHPDLKTDDRYLDLFGRRGQKRQAPTDDDDLTPSPSMSYNPNYSAYNYHTLGSTPSM
jgi:hypothetical protein